VNTRQAWIGCGTAAVMAGAYVSSHLVAVWADSPYDRWGGWAALLWALAVLWVVFKNGWNPQPWWCVSGMGCMALGMMADISAVVQTGWVLTFAGLPGISAARRCILVLSALSWMPVLGWLASGWISAETCQGVRVVWAMLSWAAIGGRK
jgi:hypothetical protein